ncbi:MAG: DUF3015 family protein [Elusimicrobia bacterium]|nr:DUF3015 family protein [Elusimicrobiota bacterium]
MAAMVLSSAAYALGASDPNAGCGWGTSAFEGKTDKKLYALFAATTNGTYTQTFGISSETAGCTVKGGWVKNEKKAAVFAEVNLQKISKEMAQGGGEYVTALATLLGCQDETAKQTFIKVTQKNYESIFTTANIDSATMLRNVRNIMAADPTLAVL